MPRLGSSWISQRVETDDLGAQRQAREYQAVAVGGPVGVDVFAGYGRGHLVLACAVRSHEENPVVAELAVSQARLESHPW